MRPSDRMRLLGPQESLRATAGAVPQKYNGRSGGGVWSAQAALGARSLQWYRERCKMDLEIEQSPLESKFSSQLTDLMAQEEQICAMGPDAMQGRPCHRSPLDGEGHSASRLFRLESGALPPREARFGPSTAPDVVPRERREPPVRRRGAAGEHRLRQGGRDAGDRDEAVLRNADEARRAARDARGREGATGARRAGRSRREVAHSTRLAGVPPDLGTTSSGGSLCSGAMAKSRRGSTTSWSSG